MWINVKGGGERGCRGLHHIRKLSRLGVYKRKFCFRCPTQKVISNLHSPPHTPLQPSPQNLYTSIALINSRTEREGGLEKIRETRTDRLHLIYSCHVSYLAWTNMFGPAAMQDCGEWYWTNRCFGIKYIEYSIIYVNNKSI